MKKIFLFALLFVACIHTSTPLAEIVELRSGPLVLRVPTNRQILAFKGVRHDVLTMTFSEKSYVAEGIVSSDEHGLTIVVFSGVFGELMRISILDGVLTYAASPQIPKEFKPEFLLVDFLMINGYTDELKAWSGGNIEVRQTLTGRTFLRSSQVLGSLEQVSGTDRSPVLLYRNHYFGYALRIETLQDD